MCMKWTYQNKEFTSDMIGDNVGFVYIIQDLSNNKKYIGKKLFFSKIRKPPLKGKTRKRTFISESDWKDYYGSSEELKEIVEKGDRSFTREILVLCQTKGIMSYMEAKIQFERDVLLRDDYFNSFIGCKIHKKHLKNLLDIKL